jgi:hypothetical protein
MSAGCRWWLFLNHHLPTTSESTIKPSSYLQLPPAAGRTDDTMTVCAGAGVLLSVPVVPTAVPTLPVRSVVRPAADWPALGGVVVELPVGSTRS